MSRWGRVVELLIVVLVALLATFGLIMGYQMYCRAYACGVGGGAVPDSAVREVVRSQLQNCDPLNPSAACNCYPLGHEAHEYNVDFNPLGWSVPNAPPNTGLVGLRVASQYSQAGSSCAGNPVCSVTVYVSLPYSVWQNTDVDGTPCHVNLEPDGKSGYAYCAFPVPARDTFRGDFRIFVQNDSTTPVNYCITHNAGISYH